MRSTLPCCELLLILALVGGFVAPQRSQAAIVDFSAQLTKGTCSLSLNKSTLALGTLPIGQFKPGQLLAPQPFVLSVQNCSGESGGSLIPTVTLTGNGVMQDNKWLFRNSGSATGVGFMVFLGNRIPEYGNTEMQNGTYMQLGAAGEIPTDRKTTFYAAATCGAANFCDSMGTGNVTANLLFSFEYK